MSVSPSLNPNEAAVPAPMNSAAPVDLPQLLQQLIEERKEFERFLEESYQALNDLREKIREEKAVVQAELEKKRQEFDTSPEKAELASLRELTQGFQKQIQEFERQNVDALAAARKQLLEVEFERESLRNELMQLHHQLEQKQRSDSGLDQLLRQLQEDAIQQKEALASEKTRLEVECGAMSVELQTLRSQVEADKAQFEQERAALTAELEQARAKGGKASAETEAKEKELEAGWKEFDEKLSMLEQFEADLRRQQEELAREREALGQQPRQPAPMAPVVPMSAPAAPPPPAPAAAPPPLTPLGAQRMINFSCKYCGKPLEVKERLAGLMTKCTGCAKMVPIPKVG
jgi:hypothetical protein